MKDQYFGDVNDFRKYAMLRVLSARMRLGVCWMLTEKDARPDGSRLAYLDHPKTYRSNDPQLFDWLKQVVSVEKDRRTVRIETSSLLGAATFQSAILPDCDSQRNTYFSDCLTRFADCDLVFFDPDNGLEIKSKPRGQRDSRKFLYWSEACNAFALGSSVLIYQHFPRERRGSFIVRMTDELREKTRAATVFTFITPHVVFLLASHEQHAPAFRSGVANIVSTWPQSQIHAAEHRVAPSEVSSSAAAAILNGAKRRDSIQEIIDLYKKDVDVTMLDENLKKTVEERIRSLEEFEAFREELQTATERQRDSVR